MFVVKRCVRDYDDVFKNVVAEFETEAEADEFADTANEYNPFKSDWFEVDEE